MPPERFEQMIADLARREFPEVRRIQHPDGGADTMRPPTAERKAEVWQAKRYGDDINWTECEDSLVAAIRRWNPSQVTFCFARDLSQQLEGAFETRLVQHPDAQAKDVAVTVWNQSELVRRLDEHPDIKVRFFGPEQQDVLVRMERFLHAGGRLESGEDLVARARTLSEYAQEQDVDFAYRILSGAPSTPAPKWDELPYVTVTVGDQQTEVQVVTWIREGAEVPLPSLYFVDTDEGQRARLDAVRALAGGARAEVTEGAQVALHAPQVVRDLAPDPSALGAGTATLNPGEAVALEVEIKGEEGVVQRELGMRPVPPKPGAAAAFAGYSGAVLMEVSFTLLEEPHIRAGISFHVHLGDNAKENAETAELLHAFYSHTQITLRSRSFFPETGELSGRYEALHQNSDLKHMEWMRRFYANLALLEKQLGIDLPQPAQITADDVDAVAAAAQVLRTGEGTATFGQAERFVENPNEIPLLPEEFRKQGSVQQMASYPIFGQEIELGMADFELPPLKVVHIAPYGTTPDAPARVVLEAEDDGQMRFRLVDWQAPDEDE